MLYPRTGTNARSCDSSRTNNKFRRHDRISEKFNVTSLLSPLFPIHVTGHESFVRNIIRACFFPFVLYIRYLTYIRTFNIIYIYIYKIIDIDSKSKKKYRAACACAHVRSTGRYFDGDFTV